MDVEIRTRHGQLASSLKDQLERRLRFALARFGDRIHRVRALLDDINGPRGGEDQHCRIEVSLVPSGTIMAEATDAALAPALGRAVERVARRIRDTLDRERTARTRTSPRLREDDEPPQDL